MFISLFNLSCLNIKEQDFLYSPLIDGNKEYCFLETCLHGVHANIEHSCNMGDIHQIH